MYIHIKKSKQNDLKVKIYDHFMGFFIFNGKQYLLNTYFKLIQVSSKYVSLSVEHNIQK